MAGWKRRKLSLLVRPEPRDYPPLAGPRRFAAAESLRGQFPGQTCVEVVCASIANLQSLHSAATAKNKEPAFGLKAGSKRMSYSHSNLKLSYGGD